MRTWDWIHDWIDSQQTGQWTNWSFEAHTQMPDSSRLSQRNRDPPNKNLSTANAECGDVLANEISLPQQIRDEEHCPPFHAKE